jgi:hypothetical protein
MASWIEGMLMLFNLNPGSLNSKEKKAKWICAFIYIVARYLFVGLRNNLPKIFSNNFR